jgi:very-short-patch-repair endonuclease
MEIIIIISILVFLVVAKFALKDDEVKVNEKLSPYAQIEDVTIKTFKSNPKYYPVIIRSNHQPNFELSTINHRIDKGIMEDYFFDYASPILKDNLSNRIQIKIGESIFTPDFYIFDQPGNHLIVEIDEPYTIDKNQNLIPIHTIEMNQNRNNLFLVNGLNLIRFAEEQIVKYPEKCVEQINNFIGGNSSNLVVPQINCWGLIQAQQLIKSKHRDTYLPFKLLNIGRTINNSSFRSLGIRGLSLFKVKGESYVKLIIHDSCNENQKNEYHSSELWIKETHFDELLLTTHLFSLLKQFNISKQEFLLFNVITYCRIEGIFTKNNNYFNVNKYDKVKLTISPYKLTELTTLLQTHMDQVNEYFKGMGLTVPKNYK